MEASKVEIKETVPASRKLQADDAKELLGNMSKLVAMKGKKVTTLNPKKDDLDECVAAMLGPTGNLRAPTLRVGKTMLVGFNEDCFSEVFKK